jgi:3D (Asp-Asp-Asp) domain-containing protein
MTTLHRCLLPLLATAAAFGLSACSSTTGSVASANSKTARKGDVIKVRTTAYTHSEPDHRRYGAKNAVGTQLRDKGIRSAAADWSRIPYGTKFKIVQTGEVYMVDDYGSALVGTNTIDIYQPNYRAMNAWGVRMVDIKILKVGSYAQSAAILQPRRKHGHVDKMARVMERRGGKRNSAPMMTQPKPAGPAPAVQPATYGTAGALVAAPHQPRRPDLAKM